MDGTLGLKAIKAAGGFTFVQDPATAKYDGMPRSAWASGAADYCLALEKIAEELARIGKRPQLRPGTRAREPGPVVPDQLGKLFVLIRSAFGNDLSQYKRATIDRRIERRMMFHKLERLEDYVRYVQQNRDEQQALYKDILIT
jgi:two-component system CheB/CheR fusion protein